MCALEMHTSVQNREYNIHLMLGLGVPEIFRHSGKQVVCLSAGPLGYAALSRHLSLGDSSRADVYYGLDIWTVDSQNEVFCAGISSPLRPSEQSGRSRDIVGTSPCSIQWKCDGGRICVLAQSNVFLLDTTEIFSAPVPRSDLAVPSKLRSVGGIFIPGTCAMGSTNDLIFFGHDDGLLLQYSWEMAFVGVVNLAASAVYLDLWPPQRLSFETLSDPAHAHRSSAGVDLRSDASISRVKPVSNEWSRQRVGELSVRVGCAVCSDGSLCFVLAPADANAGAPCQVSKRVFIESSKRSILHSRIVERYPQFDAQSTSSLNGNMLVNVAVACLVAETAADTSCCFELMVLMLSIDADSLKCLESESFLSDNYAIISVVSSTLLSANCPFKDCFDRDWSSLEYPHSVAVSNNYYSVRNVNDTTELKISLSEHTIGRIRKDEMFVILGGRVFCVKLDYRFSDEQSLSNHVLSVATVKFSLDCSKHSSVLDKKLPGEIFI